MTVEELRAENEELRRRLEEAEETVRAIRDGAVDVLVTDLTTQRHQEQLAAAHETLRASEGRLREQGKSLHAERELLRVTLTSIADAVITTDVQCRVTFLNSLAESLAGWKGADAAGQPLDAVFRIINEQSRVPLESPAALAISEGRIVRLMHHAVLLTKGGAERPIESSAAPIKDEEGRVVGCVLIFRDVAERRQAERRIDRLMTELHEADRRKDEFIAVLAHELRNPLAPIRNSLHILRMTGQHDPSVRRVGDMMERQVSHMVRLVDDLLEVSRITGGKIELRKEMVEVAAIVRTAVETSQPLIEAARHQLALEIPSESLTVDGDPVRLTQVVANLLNNAAKYTAAGGQIWLTVRREGDEVAIAVRDTGTGIPPSMLPRVFDLFTQVGRVTNSAQDGLGIGLTLVKTLVEMHGGSVQALSEGAGRGSEFVIRLSLTNARRATDPPAGEANPSVVFGPRRVLVIDDNRDAADSLGMVLKLLGADVHIVYNGADGLAALAVYKPTVVMLDIGMPGMDGYEVAHQIRQDSNDVTLIALTGWGQEEARARSHSAGFNYHLIKPVDVGALQKLLASLEGNRRSGRASS